MAPLEKQFPSLIKGEVAIELKKATGIYRTQILSMTLTLSTSSTCFSFLFIFLGNVRGSFYPYFIATRSTLREPVATVSVPRMVEKPLWPT